MNKVKRASLLVTISFLALGINYAAAKIVPGIDRPFDPPNYYSQTSISWADTNKPSFFYRDLAAQGMRVFDVTRDAKVGFTKYY